MFVSLMFIVLAAEAEAAEGPSIWNVMIPYLAVITLLYFVMSSPKRRDQARRDEGLKNLKKNDRVVTIGGIFGSVVSVSTDGKEVTLKVDDSTRIKFRKTAIAEVLGDETPAEAAPKST
ncbi:MAG: preprotein translocase subunit YajC [Planctomycetota bacterium]